MDGRADRRRNILLNIRARRSVRVVNTKRNERTFPSFRPIIVTVNGFIRIIEIRSRT